MTSDVMSLSYPLSPLQQGMLFHYLSDRHAGIDIQQIVCTLHEELDVARFRDAWDRVLTRHTALRTGFRWNDLDQPLQTVHQSAAVPFVLQDWRHLAAEMRQTELEAFLKADRWQGVDLTEAPLMRISCFRMSDAQYVCVWTMHHAVCDGRSCRNVLREVFEIYQALCRGEEARLTPSPPYVDFIRWLERQDFTEGRRYWADLLHDFGVPTPLPTPRRGRPVVDSTAALQREGRLSAGVTTALAEFARAHGFTLNTLIQGAWAIVLSRLSGEDDVVFGATRACRHWAEGVDAMVGAFINTLPVRVRVPPDQPLIPWLRELRSRDVSARRFEHTPLVEVQRASAVPAGRSLFDSIIVFDRLSFQEHLRALGGRWSKRAFRVVENTGYPVTLSAHGGTEIVLQLTCDPTRLERQLVESLVGQMVVVLTGMATDPERSLSALPSVTTTERHRQLVAWNDTKTDYPRDRCLHELIEEQVDRTPEAVALVCAGETITYRELDARANRLAHRLRKLGVGPDKLVGIHLERSIDMVVAVLATVKAGGAYVPLDPVYPASRIAAMVEAADLSIILTHSRWIGGLSYPREQILSIDLEHQEIADQPTARVRSGVAPTNLAYVIYTSGSTGRPKGVMVEHRNVVNLFVGMDARIAHESPGVWLAVTSLSFDISVLELFWTLARGFTVVLYTGDVSATATGRVHTGAPEKALEFSLFYFASAEGGAGSQGYRLLLEGARFADEHGFAAVWTPERHFHAFGGLYPNPSVTSAAIAAITKRVKIRAGSCVLPLHHPVRVAEEWSVVDNLSNGRVGISFAAGWHPNDFVLSPAHHADPKGAMIEGIGIVRRLWRGEAVPFAGPQGEVQIRTLPRPVQPELPIWITAAGNPATFRVAGTMGAFVLTHLLGQSIADVADNVEVYRRAWKEAGHAGDGHVTLMVHTFVADDLQFVKATVRQPLRDYLRSSTDLMKQFAASWPLLHHRRGGLQRADVDLAALSNEDMEELLDHSVARYSETSGLFGTPESCRERIDQLRAAGVDEIACLVDFGIPAEVVLDHLSGLDKLQRLANESHSRLAGDGSIGALIKRHGVTHLQCTPSLARMLTLEPESHDALGGLRQLLVGGEALPAALASELRALVSGDVVNVYGPTETTVWSTTHSVIDAEEPVPIGRPIANTQLYVLDWHGQPAPAGLPGELYIGGEGVARGYLGRPDLTAERFVPDPLTGRSNGRLYRTGDLARYRADGVVEFLGRADQQVKIRGHRVELAEVEAVLVRHRAVQEVVVVTREQAGALSIVAYCVPASDMSLDPEELRRHAREHLPEAMVPPIVVVIAAVPRMPNGKVNRGALPPPGESRGEAPRDTVAPETPTEKAIAEIWRDVLGTDGVGVHDNFFDLGGHSLLAVTAISRISRQLGHRFAPLDLARQTLGQLAATRDRARSGATRKAELLFNQAMRALKGVVSRR